MPRRRQAAGFSQPAMKKQPQHNTTKLFGANTAPIWNYTSDGFSASLPIFPPGDPLRPVNGLTDGANGPRQFAYTAGANIYPAPRHGAVMSFAELRNLAALYEGAQICERVIFRVARRLKLEIAPRPEMEGANKTGGAWMQEWLEDPEKRGGDLASWMTKALRDTMEIDAAAIFHRRTRGGSLFALELVAGDTIAPLVDEGGRKPRFPSPAYAQILYGAVASLWTERDIDYVVENPRTDSMYGLSAVESVALRVNQALRKEHLDLTRYTDGATPGGMLETDDPKLLGMKADQLAAIERMWNAALAGNDRMRVRTRIVPPGWSFKSIQPEATALDFDRWLLNITVSAFGLTMDELGFTDTSNRAVGDAQERVIYRNAVRPHADMYSEYFTNHIIRRYHGKPIAPAAVSFSGQGRPTRGPVLWDARYYARWQGLDEPRDIAALADAAAKLTQAGILGSDSIKRW